MDSKQLIDIFLKASTLHTACNLRAEKLIQQADKIKHSNNTAIWIKNMTKKDELILRAERLRLRGENIWCSVTSFQGKYVNWRHITDDGKAIFDIQLSISGMYDKIFQKAKQIA